MPDMDSIMLRDAQRIIGSDGTTVQYLPAGGYAIPVKCFPRAGELMPRGADGNKTVAHKLIVAISKADRPFVKRNEDQVIVPGGWVEKATDQTLRVCAVMEDRSDPGVWLLGLV